jgi:hypothetical protein
MATNERTVSHGIKPPELDASVGCWQVHAEADRGNPTAAGLDATPAGQKFDLENPATERKAGRGSLPRRPLKPCEKK